jgi:hypothetical protein
MAERFLIIENPGYQKVKPALTVSGRRTSKSKNASFASRLTETACGRQSEWDTINVPPVL